jgi:hypothetical protein
MNHTTARRVLRLTWLEQQAQHYHRLAIANGDPQRAFRAAKLWEAADAAGCTLIATEVSTFGVGAVPRALS